MTSLRVGELVKLLQSVDRNAVIVVNGEVAQGVRLAKGRLRPKGYFGDVFTPHERGETTAVKFTRAGELSTGDIEQLDL